MGKIGVIRMCENLDDKFFDYTFQVLNYAIEFAKSPGYASLRLMDVLEKTINLSLQIEEITQKEFYETVKEKFKDRVSGEKSSDDFLDELLTVFVDEWREKSINF